MKIFIADDYEQLSKNGGCEAVLEREIVEPVTASIFRNQPTIDFTPTRQLHNYLSNEK